MKLENLEVFNFKGAFRGMRNPLNSWDRSDSFFDLIDDNYFEDNKWDVAYAWASYENEHRKEFGKEPLKDNDFYDLAQKYMDWFYSTNSTLRYGDRSLYQQDIALLGPNDLELAQKLIKAGSEHRKFLRQIIVSFDLTAPLYFWKEFDTYKVGTVANSTSTMHKLASTPITLDCFETDDYDDRIQLIDPIHLDVRINEFLTDLEQLRQLYNETGDKRYWKELIRWLPESWLQTRTITMSYENILNLIHHRHNHKLSEWRWLVNNFKEKLPYAYELLFFTLEENK